MNVAICERSLRAGMPELPLAELFDQAAALGYDGVELSTSRERGAGARDRSPGEAAAIREAALARGLEIPTACADWMPAYAELHPDLDDWDPATGRVREDADVAAAASARVLVVTLGSARGTWGRARSLLDAWAALGARRGVKLGVDASAYHRSGLGDLDALIRMVDEVGSPFLGIYAHADQPGMGDAEGVRRVGRRLVGLRSSALRPDVDYDATFDALCDVDYHWYWIFDVGPADLATSRRRFDEIWRGAADL